MAKPARKYEFSHAAVPFDPLKYVKQLEQVGFTRDQAEVQAETFLSIVQEQLITKYDLKELENEIKHDMKELEGELKQNMKELEGELKHNMKELEGELKQNIKELETKTTIESESIRRDIKELETKTTTQLEILRRDLKVWLGGMLVSLVLIFSTIVTLIPHLTKY
jgi:gas vesicle protein